MQPRLIGNGPATVWFDDAELGACRQRGPDAATGPAGNAARPKTSFLNVVLHTADGTLWASPIAAAAGSWTQWPRNPIVVLDAKTVESGFT